ncbi:hypothetical protein OHA40_29500 [Nocardia sp. NBC_00508]|uniref:hypothetical protein n=1 Tax=Nocardia sp. NBC_00508 TaxID=2975992 RepID=UPI002E81FADC|nr:hypothetical protein [Nocardia sp. NBC_00508]WUD65705.1 hypothetical protein OHA40_29500 [Nocardia sp. NBC_00508]
MAPTHLAAAPDRKPTARPHRGGAPEPLPAASRLHRPLMVTAAVMAALAVVSIGGMLADDRVLLGESVWLKPCKFGVAFTLYSLTLAWLLSLPHRGSRVTWWLGTVFAVTGVLDVGFIAVQAARGTFSHFNNADPDPVNRIGQTIFMSGVPGLFFANLLIVLILSWQRVADRPTARAIHAGLGLAVVGMALGYVMGYTGKQLVRGADGRVVELIAGHTVLDDAARSEDARDGLASMPITHWSTVGGDLRIPHFVGLHGIQVLLLVSVALAWLAPRYGWLRAERARAAVVGVLAAGYSGLLALVFWQAMRAQPLVHPDRLTWAAAAGLAATVAALLGAVYVRHRGTGRPTAESVSADVPRRG